METVWTFQYQKYIYKDSNIFMVSLCVTDSYFNNEQIKIGDIEMISSVYVSSR